MVHLNSLLLFSAHLPSEYKPSLLLFSALSTPPFRSIKLRSRKPTCPACGTAEERLGTISDIDYVQFCGGLVPDWESRGLIQGDADHRTSTKVGQCSISLGYQFSFFGQELNAALKTGKLIHIVDVRPETEFGICHLPSSISTVNTSFHLERYMNLTVTRCPSKIPSRQSGRLSPSGSEHRDLCYLSAGK